MFGDKIPTMKAAICVLLGFVANTVLAGMRGECDMASFYMELGCTPMKTDESSACPDAFSCPDLHPDPTMCYYRGVAYSDRSYLPQEVVRNPCLVRCGCQISGTPRIECAAVDCVETFDPDTEQCISTYELDSCCSDVNVCGKDAIAKLSTCEVEGKSYKEGQMFYPSNNEKACICTSQWNGSLDNPEYCRDLNCGIEITFQAQILNNCAPIFFGNVRSCPIGFQCATPKTEVRQGLNVRSVDSMCTFGNMTLSVGNELIIDEECLKCSCEVPPFVSCVKTRNC